MNPELRLALRLEPIKSDTPEVRRNFLANEQAICNWTRKSALPQQEVIPDDLIEINNRANIKSSWLKIRNGPLDTGRRFIESFVCSTATNRFIAERKSFILSSTPSCLLIIVVLITILLLALAGGQTLAQEQPGGLMSYQVGPTLSGQLGGTRLSKNSGIMRISQLCTSRSQIPVSRLNVDGAVLVSEGDFNLTCTITLRTKSARLYFIVRFEELRLGCTDHLRMFDNDVDYGRPSIKDFSCRDNLANVPVIRTTGTYLTLRYSTDTRSRPSNGFRMVLTAVLDESSCPGDYASCRSGLCISRSLFCDNINHCVDNSDELNCPTGSNGLELLASGQHQAGEWALSQALGLLVLLVLVIFVCVILFIAFIYCRSDTTGQLHGPPMALGLAPGPAAFGAYHQPALQASRSSYLFAGGQPAYQLFQPAALFPGQHALATLPRGYHQLATGAGQVVAGAGPYLAAASQPANARMATTQLIQQPHYQQQQQQQQQQIKRRTLVENPAAG